MRIYVIEVMWHDEILTYDLYDKATEAKKTLDRYMTDPNKKGDKWTSVKLIIFESCTNEGGSMDSSGTATYEKSEDFLYTTWRWPFFCREADGIENLPIWLFPMENEKDISD